MTENELGEQPLVRALQAPGSQAELGAEQRYRAMFRDAMAADPTAGLAGSPATAPHPARRAARRLGAGTGLAAAFAVASTGVAAAYSSSLPDPVQRAVHSVLAPLGVPAAPTQREAQPPPAPGGPQTPPPPEPTASTSVSAPASTSSATSSPTSAPSSAPSPDSSDLASAPPLDEPSPDVTQAVSPDSSSPTAPVLPAPTSSGPPTGSADPTATAGPSTSPSATPGQVDPTAASPTTGATASGSSSPSGAPVDPTLVPASVAITAAGAGQLVAPGGTAVVTGRVLDAAGRPVPGVAIVLQRRSDQGGWLRLATTSSAADGTVAVATGPIERTTAVRLQASGVRSEPWRLAVQPVLAASAQTSGHASTVSVSAAGGQPGDLVVVLTWRGGQPVEQARGFLDAAGRATIGFAAPDRTRTYAVRLLATAAHAGARTRVAVLGVAPPGATVSPAPGG